VEEVLSFEEWNRTKKKSLRVGRPQYGPIKKKESSAFARKEINEGRKDAEKERGVIPRVPSKRRFRISDKKKKTDYE